LQGFVVGFKASKIFCLHFVSMQTIDVPQSASMHRYLERRDFERALEVACLGVTESDWRELATQALLGLSLGIARKAFIRVRDMRYIELLNRIEITRRQMVASAERATLALNNGVASSATKEVVIDDSVFMADILAYQGRYDEAARLYLRGGQRRKAVEMYLDLRDWEKAKDIVEQYQPNTGASASADGANGEVDSGKRSVFLRICLRVFDRPARIPVLLGETRRVLLPGVRDAPRLNGFLLFNFVALRGRGDNRGVDDLAAHRQKAGSTQNFVEPLEKAVDGPRLLQGLAERPDRIGVGHWVSETTLADGSVKLTLRVGGAA
jgi:hypothetical protein